MTQSKIIRLLITEGPEEEVLAVLTRERHPNQFGVVVPPITVDHEGKEYILKRTWADGMYVYHPCHKGAIDDFLAP